MSVRTSHRSVGAVIAGASLLLGACGGSDSSSATEPTIDLGDSTSTEYQTLPPATTVATVPEEEAETGGEQEYTVQAGDYGLLVADKFGVSLEDLENVNGWASANNEFPGPGEVILIPAGATTSDTAGGSTGDSTGDSTDGTTGDSTESTDGEGGTAITDPGDNCGPGRYTIAADDNTRIKVANKFDVTVEELDAANTGTEGYSAFYPGLEIVIPGGADC